MAFPFPPGGFPMPPGGGGFPSPGFPSPGSPGAGFPPPPHGHPPSRTPSSPGQFGHGGTRPINARSFAHCMFRFTFVWLRSGRSFWFYPVVISRDFVAGYRWNGFQWRYYGTQLNRIAYFTC